MARFNEAVLVTKSYFQNKQVIEAKGDNYLLMTIPVDPDNADYQEILRLQESGELVVTERVD